MFLFRFYILCENFNKIGPIIIKKIPKFWDDFLKDPNLPMKAVKRKHGPLSLSRANSSGEALSSTRRELQLLPALLDSSRRHLTRGSLPFRRGTSRGAGNLRTAHTTPGNKTRTPHKEDGIEDAPVGRLQFFQEAWVDAPASKRAIIKRGFHWEWISNPPALFTPKLMTRAPDLGEVSKLVQKGGYLQSPSTTLLLSKPLQRSQRLGGISPHHKSLSPEQVQQGSSFYHDLTTILFGSSSWKQHGGLLWISRMLTFTFQSGRTFTSSWPSLTAINFISSRFSLSASRWSLPKSWNIL